MRPHAKALLLALGALAACTPSFDGPERVKSLRLLAVEAEPPELGAAADGSGPGWPAARAGLRSLVVHPRLVDDPAPLAVVLHLACTPTPGDAGGTACSQVSELASPADLLQLASPEEACAAPGQGALGRITFSGLEACGRDGCAPFSVLRDPEDPGSAVALPAPAYALPDAFSLSALPAGHPQRTLGIDVVDLALVVAARPEELAPAAAAADACAALGAALGRLAALWPDRAHLASLKWLHVRGPEMPAASPPNQNPAVSGMKLGGTALPAPGGTPAAVRAGEGQDLLPILPGDFEALRERYQRFDSDGALVDTRDEEWAYSWFTTAGDLHHAHTNAWDEPDRLTPDHGRALLWLVVRDLRGGMAFTAAEVEAP